MLFLIVSVRALPEAQAMSVPVSTRIELESMDAVTVTFAGLSDTDTDLIQFVTVSGPIRCVHEFPLDTKQRGFCAAAPVHDRICGRI